MIERYCYVLEYYYPRYQNILQDVIIKSKSWFYTCIKWQLTNSVCRVATWIFCVCIYMCVYTYVYIYIVYAYTHMHIFLYIYTYSMLHFILNIRRFIVLSIFKFVDLSIIFLFSFPIFCFKNWFLRIEHAWKLWLTIDGRISCRTCARSFMDWNRLAATRSNRLWSLNKATAIQHILKCSLFFWLRSTRER